MECVSERCTHQELWMAYIELGLGNQRCVDCAFGERVTSRSAEVLRNSNDCRKELLVNGLLDENARASDTHLACETTSR